MSTDSDGRCHRGEQGATFLEVTILCSLLLMISLVGISGAGDSMRLKFSSAAETLGSRRVFASGAGTQEPGIVRITGSNTGGGSLIAAQ